MTIKEESKKWSRARLRDELLLLAEHTKAWEQFLISELGETTYNDLCRTFALSECEKWLQSMNMPEDDVTEIMHRLGETEKEYS